MRFALAAMLALAPAWAQIAKPVAATAATGTPAGTPKAQPRVALSFVSAVEKTFDGMLRSYNFNDPIDLLGSTRGVYLDGYGTVFTAEVSLIVTPGISPFHQTITEPEKASVHQRKLSRLPVLKQMMSTWLKTINQQQFTGIPDNEQLVLAVRLLYLPWEKTEGMPAMITVKGTHRGILAGQIQTDEQ